MGALSHTLSSQHSFDPPRLRRIPLVKGDSTNLVHTLFVPLNMGDGRQARRIYTKAV